jgi:hypothetical protein
MTDEERFSKLDARIEAIAMNLELTASMAHANEVRMEKFMEKILTVVEKDAENIRALARIAEIHEHRLSDLEGRERKN